MIGMSRRTWTVVAAVVAVTSTAGLGAATTVSSDVSTASSGTAARRVSAPGDGTSADRSVPDVSSASSPASAARAAGTAGRPVVPPGLDPCRPVLACGEDLDAALELERRIDDHFVSGQIVEIDYATAERIPGDVADVGAWGDSGLWTGTYLAAESFRYATAEKYLAKKKLSDEQRAFWTAQRDQALPRIQRIVDQYHLLTNIAREWKTQTSPSLTPTNTKAPASFGGGIVAGEAGMLMRSCALVDAPPNADMARNGRVFGPWRWEDGRDYICETAPSRDTYAGTTFGLLTAFDLVAKDHPAMAAQIRDDILTLAGFLVKYGWTYPRPHGNVSLPPFGHDFDNFVSPLFVYVPMARLNMAQAARHVAAVNGSASDQTKWNAVYAEELASQGPSLAASMEIDSVQSNEGYYKFNLHHLTGYNLTRIESDPAVRTLYKQAIGVMDRTTGDDVNAHFEAVTYAMTGEASRRDAAVEHVRQWRDYRARIATGVDTTNQTRCGVTIDCVPQDQLDVVVGPDDDVGVKVPGTSAKMRARRPLPVADRPPTDFLWQRPSTQLNGGASATHQAPGVDYLLPYWMLRYHTEVAEPALEPFPPYPGPSHQ